MRRDQLRESQAVGRGAKPVVGISPPDFWQFFDNLSKRERDALNYAQNGPEMKDIYAGICAVRFPSASSR